MVSFDLNGEVVAVDAPSDMPLLWVLRDRLGLTGTKYGCGIAACGACTVHVDGAPTRACVTPLSTVAGKRLATIEGVTSAGGDRVSRAVEEAWVRLEVAQCGYCQPGQVMAAIALLRGNGQPTDADIDAALSGNVCRCATYVRIRAAVKLAAKSLA